MRLAPFFADNNGNLTGDGVYTYGYDQANRLTALTQIQDLTTTTFAYNGLGDRLKENDTTFVLDLAASLTQALQDETHTYLYGNDRIAQQSASSTTYFLGDALGSVRQLVDERGTVALTQSYGPYGQVLNSTGSGSSDYGFAGEWTHSSTNLLYLRARFYNPKDGRFFQLDPVVSNSYHPVEANKYTYSWNNPINKTDPSGKYPICFGSPCGDDTIIDNYFKSLRYPDVKEPKQLSISVIGINLIKSFESNPFKTGLKHYNDMYNDGNYPTDEYFYDRNGNGKGECTIGWGHLIHTGPCDKNEHGFVEAEFEHGLSASRAYDLLLRDIGFAERYIHDDVKVKLTQPQYDALTSLIFNWGGPKFELSLHLMFLNQARYAKAAEQIRKQPVYARGGNYPLDSLVRRRAIESNLFLSIITPFNPRGHECE